MVTTLIASYIAYQKLFVSFTKILSLKNSHSQVKKKNLKLKKYSQVERKILNLGEEILKSKEKFSSQKNSQLELKILKSSKTFSTQKKKKFNPKEKFSSQK